MRGDSTRSASRSRRGICAAVPVIAGALACGRTHAVEASQKSPSVPSAQRGEATTSATPSATPAPPSRSELTFRYERTPFGPSEVVVLIPENATPGHRLPVLVAFHGRGESLKGPHLGARGWADDYAVRAAAKRLGSPPLSVDDFLGWVTPGRLLAMNRSLAARPYGGVILVCPYLPDALHGARMLEEGNALADFVVDEVLPRVARETPAIGTPLTTSVDGVSLGGRAALLVGLLRPEAFHAVGAMQPAIDDDETGALAELAAQAAEKNPGLSVRLLSSDGDFFLPATMGLDRALTTRHVRHRLDVVQGPHSYEFNRGPGAYEMLLFHDRALGGLEAP